MRKTSIVKSTTNERVSFSSKLVEAVLLKNKHDSTIDRLKLVSAKRLKFSHKEVNSSLVHIVLILNT